MKKNLQGSFTVEAAFIVPIILVIFGMLMHILFYWHDKILILSTAHETAVLGSSRLEMSEQELENYFHRNMRGRLLLMEKTECEVSIGEEKIIIQCTGKKDAAFIRAKLYMNVTNPEKYIRDVRKLKKIGEGIEKQN